MTGLHPVDAPAGVDARIWSAPAGTTGALHCDPDVAVGADTGADVDLAPELLWSTRAAELPSTRAVVVLDGPADPDRVRGFESVHRIAERVATALDPAGETIGPIEILVFRPRPGCTPTPRPRRTADRSVVEFLVPHDGGVTATLTLTLPTTDSETQ